MIKMISKTKKISILIIAGFVFPLLVNLHFNFSVEQNFIENINCSALEAPILIDGIATGVDAHNWTWAEEQLWCSGSGTDIDPYIIQDLTINGFGLEDGIEILNSNVSFIIQDCLIYNSTTGIYLDKVNNSRLINNTCSNINWGISLEYSNNNTISGNTANGNNYEGIYLTVCNYNYITGNIANNNDDTGIHLQTECVNNTLSGNTANDNGDSGIDIEEDCSNNTISGNKANDNDDTGIYIKEDCSNNNISGNTANHNTQFGIYLDFDCDYNTITNNIFHNNTLGIRIDSSNCDSNSIYQNFFLENGKHAEDDGTDNTWNSTSIGNYWDNWTSPDVSPNDGIVDLQYNISGSAGSKDYLPIAEDGAPVIVINSPASSDVFGVTAPSFDVTITDVYVDSMWYTIDGGINNYTFIENGVINQTAWAALNEGDVTITFYAKDIIGNEASESVTVVKMISAAVLEPGIIITIVVVSVAGGVATVAVIYLYLKKRKSPK